MKAFFLILKLLLLVALIVALILGGLILYATLTDFRPDDQLEMELVGQSTKKLESDSLSFLIWNIGYCGLGAEVDFFYDGGKNVITPKNLVEKNFDGVKKTLGNYKNTDFILLQEVDMESKRSHYLNQEAGLDDLFTNMSYAHGINYDVKFIPIPFTEPMGKVKSGLVSLSPYGSTENTRYQFPGNFKWPKSLFFLDRCFLLQRFPVKNGKDLIVINTHNSAYDDGSLKKRQMKYMKDILLAEYEKGNYIVVGGDWNQTAPGYDNLKFAKKGGQEPIDQIAIDFDYMPKGWIWAYDPDTPTNRKTSEPYDKSRTFRTVIDFYLISPNVKLNKVKGVDVDFQYSDHQAVYMEVVLD